MLPEDVLIIPIALTPTNALLAYSLTKEVVFKLRSAQAWKYDETKAPKVTLNVSYVRTIFHDRTTVKRLVRPLHPNKRTSTPTTDPNCKMTFNFLTEMALTAFSPTEKGEYLDTAPAICHDAYSGDLNPKVTNNERSIHTRLDQHPFSWPDINLTNQQPLPNKENPPGSL